MRNEGGTVFSRAGRRTRDNLALPRAAVFANAKSIHEGWWADLAIFDPEKVNDPSTFSDPHHYSTGFRYVLVNGVVVIDNDHHNGTRPGKVLHYMDRVAPPPVTPPTPAESSEADPAQ